MSFLIEIFRRILSKIEVIIKELEIIVIGYILFHRTCNRCQIENPNYDKALEFCLIGNE